jgi:hypothetical protein
MRVGAFFGALMVAPDELEVPDAFELPDIEDVAADGVVVTGERLVAVTEELDRPGI